MYFHQDISGCLSKRIKGHGVDQDFLKPLVGKLEKTLHSLRKAYEEETLPFLRLPYLRKDLHDAKDLVLRMQDDFSDVVILGTGGSSLGGQALCALVPQAYPKLHFMENIDPQTFEELFETIDPQTTAFIVISKSGETMETLLQFMVCVKKWTKELGPNAPRDHFVVITEAKESSLKKLADQFHIPLIDHDPKIGGRFSVLSMVGCLPFMVAGIDPVSVREGAARVFDRLLMTDDVTKIDAAVGAALSFALAQKNKTLSVLMPYADRLHPFVFWYRQLWAESLGKQGLGTTPILSWGTVDQHSQLQLYLDGPQDKMFTIIKSKFQGKGLKVLPELVANYPDLKFLGNASMGDLMEAEQQATIDTLIKNNCPTRVLEVPELTPDFMGVLMMHFMLETIFLADLYEINPFDQPAVESGKILAKKYLHEILTENRES